MQLAREHALVELVDQIDLRARETDRAVGEPARRLKDEMLAMFTVPGAVVVMAICLTLSLVPVPGLRRITIGSTVSRLQVVVALDLAIELDVDRAAARLANGFDLDRVERHGRVGFERDGLSRARS